MGLCEIHKSLILKGDNFNCDGSTQYWTVLEMEGKSLNFTAT